MRFQLCPTITGCFPPFSAHRSRPALPSPPPFLHRPVQRRSGRRSWRRLGPTRAISRAKESDDSESGQAEAAAVSRTACQPGQHGGPWPRPSSSRRLGQTPLPCLSASASVSVCLSACLVPTRRSNPGPGQESRGNRSRFRSNRVQHPRTAAMMYQCRDWSVSIFRVESPCESAGVAWQP